MTRPALPTPLRLSPEQQVQRHMVELKRLSLDSVPAPEKLEGSILPFIKMTGPYVAFPAAGAAATVLLSYTVPAGLNGLVNLMSVFAAGGSNFVNGSGTAVWRALVNGAGVKGYENMQSQFGSDSLPIPTLIMLNENDLLQITVEVPNGQVPPTGTTGARVHGNAAHASLASIVNLAIGAQSIDTPARTYSSSGGRRLPVQP